jgi:hypothetical protein
MTGGKLSDDLTFGVAGEEAALFLQAAFGPDALVAGEQADGGGRVVRGSSVSAAVRISGLIPTARVRPVPSAVIVIVIESMSYAPAICCAYASS